MATATAGTTPSLPRTRPYISISGLIGAGKTTLAKSLAETLQLPLHLESVEDNSYLQAFYRDMKTNAYDLQLYLLNQRFKQQQRVCWNGQGGVQDRTIYEDSVFAKMLTDAGYMTPQNYKTYLALFETMSHLMIRPTIIVHLDVTPAESLRRIKKRGRECEKGITLEYLESLHQAYEEYLQEVSKSIRVMRVDWNTPVSTELVARSINKEMEDMRSIRPIVLLSE